MDVTTGLVEPFGWGLGYPDWITPSSPAAGANFAYTIDGSNYVRVLGVRCLVTTDANAANRLVSVDYINGRSTTMMRNAGSVLVAANTTNQAFEWNVGRTLAEWNTSTPVFAPLCLTFLPPGFSIQITLDNIQVGDQISAIRMWVERFPTGARGEPQGMITGEQYMAHRYGIVPD